MVMKMPMRLPSEPRDSISYLKGYEDAKLDYEVRHGRWINDRWEGGVNYHTCNACGVEIRVTYFDNYCPNCGTRMDGDADE